MNKFDKSNKRDQQIRLNHNIKCPKIKIVGTDSIITNSEAQELAKSKGLDLVEVNYIRNEYNESISICKLLDYDKYIYEKKKSDKLAAKKARENRIDIKLIQFHITSDTADVLRKCNKIKELISNGNKVKAEIFFRGREQQMTELSNSMMDTIINSVNDIAVIDVPPRYEGRTYSCVLKKIKVQNKSNVINVSK